MREPEDSHFATRETRAGSAFASTVDALSGEDLGRAPASTPSQAFQRSGSRASRPLPLAAAWVLWTVSLVLTVVTFAAFFGRIAPSPDSLPRPDLTAGNSEFLQTLLDLVRWPHFMDVRRLFVFVVGVGAALFVAWRRPREAMALLFGAFAAGIASLPTSGYLLWVATDRLQASPWQWVVVAGYTCLVFSSYSFVALFPDGRLGHTLRWLVVPLWGLGTLFVPLRWWLWPGLIRPAFFGAVAIGLVLCLVSTLRHRRHADTEARAQFKLFVLATVSFLAAQIVAMFVLLPLVGLRAAPVAVLSTLSLELLLMGSTALAFVLFTLGVARYHLWDVDVVINRSLVYGGLFAALALVFVFAFLIFGLGLQAWLGARGQLWALLVGAVSAAVLFKPTLSRLKRFVDAKLYGIRVDYEALARARRGSRPPRPPATADARVTFGAFTDLEPIGRGGMGQIYRATDTRSGERVALKILREHLIDSEDSERRFLREAEIAGRLRHPNVIVMHDCGVIDATPYLAMELVEGADLATLLRERRALPLTEALPLLGGVAAALDHAHDHGVVHRDVKPSNILLDGPTPRPVLTDFGIAFLDTAQTRLTRQGAVLGTLDYISPEQIHGEQELTGRADIYALGITAFEMLTGTRPFVEERAVRLAMAHLVRPPPDPRELAPYLSRSAAQAIGRALRKDPEDRFPTAGQFVEALAAP